MKRLSRLLRAIGWAVLFLLWAPVGSAQVADEPAGGSDGVPRLGGEAADPLLIALAPAVQAELKLSEGQKGKIARLAKSAGDRSRGVAPDGQVDPQARLGVRRQVDRELARILDKRQGERLNQIVMQADGPLAVARPEVVRKLNLTPEQEAAVQGVMIQWQRLQREVLVMTGPGGRFGDEGASDNYARMRLASSRLRRQAVQQVGAILDRRQKFLLEKMLGAPFDLGKLHRDAGPDAAAGSKDPKEPPDAKSSEDESPQPKADPPKRRKGRGRKARPPADS